MLVSQGKFYRNSHIKRNIIQLLYLLGVVVLLAVFFPACAGPSVAVESSYGFTHEVSVRVPFKPPEDSVARLYIDDEGITIFIKHIEIHHGSVNPREEHWREIYKIDKHGTVETEKFGPFETIRRLKPEGNFLALEDVNSNKVTYVDIATVTSRSVVDSKLADIIRNHYSADYYDSGLVVYTITSPDNRYLETGIAIYNTSTREEVRVDLQEEYGAICPIDIDGDNILMHATKHISQPPVLHVIGLDGTHKLKLTLYGLDRLHAYDAKLVPEGLVVATKNKYAVYTSNATIKIGPACLLKRYSFDGKEEWTRTIPVLGGPRLKLLPNEDSDVLALTLVSSNDDTGFIGYFTTEEGEQVYAHNFQSFTLIWPLDTIGSFYIYPQWSLYPDEPPPSGRVALFSYDSELATVDFDEGIYYFAASPSRQFFAVVSDRTVSMFSKPE